MKCISDLSYSGMFTAENSKKFDFKRIIEAPKKQGTDEEENKTDDIHNLEKRKLNAERAKSKNRETEQKKADRHNLTKKEQEKEDSKQNMLEAMMSSVPYRFSGQKDPQRKTRNQFLLAMAKVEVLERKNELGLILDLIASCLDVDPKKRPTIQGLLTSPMFFLDPHEKTNAVRFSQNVILYRSP